MKLPKIIVAGLFLFFLSPLVGIDPIGKAVITKIPVKTFGEALDARITIVKDGDPVYFCILLPKKVKEYTALTTNPYVTKYSDQILELEVGPAGTLHDTYERGFMEPSPEELKSNFLCINLAPGILGQYDGGVWLKTVGGGVPGVWHNEIRLWTVETKKNKGQKTLLAVAPLTASVPNSITKYSTQNDKYDEKFKAGDVSFNEAPIKGKFKNEKILEKVKVLVDQELGFITEFVFFLYDKSIDFPSTPDKTAWSLSNAGVLFKRNDKFWYCEIFVSWSVDDGKTKVTFHFLRELSSANYAKALKDTQ